MRRPWRFGWRFFHAKRMRGMRGGADAVVKPLMPVPTATMGAIAVAAPSTARRETPGPPGAGEGRAAFATRRNTAANGMLAIANGSRHTTTDAIAALKYAIANGARTHARGGMHTHDTRATNATHAVRVFAISG